MNCDEFKQWFQDHEDTELTIAASNHLKECSHCQQIYELDQRLEEKLKLLLEPLEPPELLKERLSQNLSETRYPWPQSITGWKKLGPALAMAAMVVFFLFPFNRTEHPFTSMAQIGQFAFTDHNYHGLGTYTEEKIKNIGIWSLEELGYEINYPKVPDGAKLVKVVKCKLGDCDTAHLIFNQGERRFSVYVFPEKEVGFSLEEERLYSLNVGMNLVKLWKTGNQVQVMIT